MHKTGMNNVVAVPSYEKNYQINGNNAFLALPQR